MLKRWIALTAIVCFTSAAWSQTPATAPAPDTSKLPPEVKAALDAMQKTIADQNKRIAELESRQGNDEKIRREEIVAVLKEMKITGDKRANDMRVYYKDGLKFDSADGNFKLGINGRVFDDWAWINATESGDKLHQENRDGTELRSVRLKFSGEVYKDYFYMVELEFAGGTVAAKDIYMGMKNIPVVGNFRVGHFKEPFSLDDLTGDSNSLFMEYALPFALVPDRRLGMMANNAILNERMTWAVGMFRNSDQDVGNSWQVSSDKGYNVTGRVTGLPWYENNGKQLLHLGAAYSFRTPNDAGTVTYSTRPEAHLANTILAVTVDDNHSNLFGGEVATVLNSFHAESEFIASGVDTKIDGTPCYQGFYAQAGYFLTGETRPYNKANGVFGHVNPLKNFRDGNGLGAWEIAARYSYLNLDQDQYGTVGRGELQDVTVGLNWYLNPNMRIMWNYIHAMPDTTVLSNAEEIFMMRFQVDF